MLLLIREFGTCIQVLSDAMGTMGHGVWLSTPDPCPDQPDQHCWQKTSAGQSQRDEARSPQSIIGVSSRDS